MSDIHLTKRNSKLFTMTAKLIFGLVPEDRLDDFLREYQIENHKVQTLQNKKS